MKLNPTSPSTGLDVPFRAPASSIGAQVNPASPPEGIISTVAWHSLPLPKEEETLSRPRRDPYEASREAHRRESIRAAGDLLRQGVTGKKGPGPRDLIKLVPKTGQGR